MESVGDEQSWTIDRERRPYGLDALLADLAAQVVTVITQPLRAEHFAPAPGPRVLTVEVRRIEGSGPA